MKWSIQTKKRKDITSALKRFEKEVKKKSKNLANARVYSDEKFVYLSVYMPVNNKFIAKVLQVEIQSTLSKIDKEIKIKYIGD